jgi:hypothetical protein
MFQKSLRESGYFFVGGKSPSTDEENPLFQLGISPTQSILIEYTLETWHPWISLYLLSRDGASSFPWRKAPFIQFSNHDILLEASK